MSKFRYGLISFILSEINADGITPVNPVDLTPYVYKKSLTVNEPEGTKTEHFAESQIYASIILNESAPEVAKVSLFNLPLEVLENLKGGVATIVDGKTTYVRPNKNTVIERQIKMVTKDNVSKTYIRAFIDVVQDQKVNDSDVDMWNLTMIPMLPTDGSEAVIIKEE